MHNNTVGILACTKMTLRLSTTSQIMHIRAKHNTASHLIHDNSYNMIIKPTHFSKKTKKKTEDVCQKTQSLFRVWRNSPWPIDRMHLSHTAWRGKLEVNLAHHSTKNNTGWRKRFKPSREDSVWPSIRKNKGRSKLSKSKHAQWKEVTYNSPKNWWIR